jgi:PAS domain S-box-containing protein
VDQWRLWEKKSGIHVELSGLDWSEAQRRMRAGEFDVIDTIFKTPSRQTLYDFSPPYQRLEVPIFFDKDIAGITGVASLKGFPVAVKSGDAAIELLKDNGVTHLVEYPSYEAIIRAAAEHKVNVFVVDKPPALYFLHKSGIAENFRESKPLVTGEFHRAVRKGKSGLLQTVEQGFATITPAEYAAIEKRWYGSTITGDGFQARYLFYAAGAAGVVILLLLISNRLLRRMVHRRTDELAASEERYRTLVDNIPLGITVIGPDKRIEMVNRAHAEMLGHPQEWFVGRLCHCEFEKRDLPCPHCPGDVSLKTGGIAMVETEGVDKDGNRIAVQIHTVPLPGKDGQPEAFIEVVENITERRLAEAERDKVQKLESLGVLAGGIAHDFNNILTGIMGNISFARMLVGEEHKAYKRLLESEKAAKRAGELTHQLLTFARGGEPVRTSVDVQQLIDEALSFALRGSNVKGSLVCHPGIWQLDADPGQMSQVFNNLLINARQAMPLGGNVAVTAGNIEVHGGDPAPVVPGRYVRITVADEGSGIAPEHVSRIFDPYFTTKELGSGLGLASLHSIIKRHGGAVTVSSLPGAGTTFTLFLPAATEPPAREYDVQKDVSPPQGSGKILVMDDEEIIRELAVALLEDLGYSAEVCPDGSQAVALHAASREDGATPYAAIILDLTVPGGMGGREAAVRIRAVDPRVPLIVSSGYSSDTQISECLALGFNGAVRKPYTLQEITAELSRVIGEAKRG